MKDRAQEIARDLGTRFAVMVSQAQVLPDPSIPCVAPWSFEGPILAAIRAAMDEARREEREAWGKARLARARGESRAAHEPAEPPLVCPSCHGEGEGCPDTFHEPAPEPSADARELARKILEPHGYAEDETFAEAARLIEAWAEQREDESLHSGCTLTEDHPTVRLLAEVRVKLAAAEARAEKAIAQLGDLCPVAHGDPDAEHNCHGAIMAEQDKLAAELAQAKAERDEARATKDMHKERQQQLLARIKVLERKK